MTPFVLGFVSDLLNENVWIDVALRLREMQIAKYRCQDENCEIFLLKRWHNLVPNHIKLGTTVLWWRLNIFERGILGVLFGKCRSCTKHFACTFLSFCFVIEVKIQWLKMGKKLSFVGMSLFIAVLLMIFTSHSVGILETLFSRQIKSSYYAYTMVPNSLL